MKVPAENIIDASTSDNVKNIIVANFEDTPESIVGSNQSDVIYLGAGDTVDSGGGFDIVNFADGTYEIETQEVSDTVTTLMEAAKEYFVSSTFYDNHSRQYVGLGTNTNSLVYGFETGTEDYSDVVYLTEGNVDDLSVNWVGTEVEIDNGAGKTVLLTAMSTAFPRQLPKRLPQLTVFW